MKYYFVSFTLASDAPLLQKFLFNYFERIAAHLFTQRVNEVRSKGSALGRRPQSAKSHLCRGLFFIVLSCYPTARSRGVAPNSGFLILSFCRSVKESIKESAFDRRQELPAGTGAAPLCQPLKCGTDYRDVTATLKMKHSRRLWAKDLRFRL